MDEQTAIERITAALATSDGNDYPMVYYRSQARAAWDEIKAIAREEPRHWLEMDAYIWNDGMVTSEPTEAARHDHMMILERP